MKKVSDNQIVEVYDEYCRILGKNPNRYKLTSVRKKLIEKRLQELGSDDLVMAFRNLAKSLFHVDQGHTGLEIILRKYEKVETWRDKTTDQLRSSNRMYLKDNPEAERRYREKKQRLKRERRAFRFLQAEKTFKALPEPERQLKISQMIARLMSEAPSVYGKADPKVLRDTAVMEIVKEMAG